MRDCSDLKPPMPKLSEAGGDSGRASLGAPTSLARGCERGRDHTIVVAAYLLAAALGWATARARPRPHRSRDAGIFKINAGETYTWRAQKVRAGVPPRARDHARIPQRERAGSRAESACKDILSRSWLQAREDDD